MRLSDFMLSNIDAIVQEWAAVLPPSSDSEHMRRQLAGMLATLAGELALGVRTDESSSVLLPAGLKLDLAACCALRATVIRRWTTSLPGQPVTASMVDELVRFNQAIDQFIRACVCMDSTGQCAQRDALTGLPNRNLLFDRLEQQLKHGERTGKRTALLRVDLEHFKNVKLQFGDGVGDQLLQQVAVRLASCIRETDTLAHLEGEEFSIILQDLADDRSAALVAKEILYQLSDPFPVQGRVMRLDGRIGIAVSPQDSRLPDALLRHAGQAMEQARQAGRDRYRFFSLPKEPFADVSLQR